MHVQSVQKYCFSLSNMQICGVFVAVVVVVANRRISTSYDNDDNRTNCSNLNSINCKNHEPNKESLKKCVIVFTMSSWK